MKFIDFEVYKKLHPIFLHFIKHRSKYKEFEGMHGGTLHDDITSLSISITFTKNQNWDCFTIFDDAQRIASVSIGTLSGQMADIENNDLECFLYKNNMTLLFKNNKIFDNGIIVYTNSLLEPEYKYSSVNLSEEEYFQMSLIHDPLFVLEDLHDLVIFGDEIITSLNVCNSVHQLSLSVFDYNVSTNSIDKVVDFYTQHIKDFQ